MSLYIETIDIQHDWNVGIKESDKHFWVSCRLQGQLTSDYGDVLQNALLNAPQQCGNFTVNKCNSHSVSITSRDEKCTTAFLAPFKSVKLHKLIHCMDISSSGALGVCSAGDGNMWIWDTSTGETRRTLDGHVGDVYSCRYFPSGVVILSGGADTRLKIWSIQDGSCARTLTGHKRVINDTAIVDKGRNIISVAADGVAKLWDCGSAKCISDLANLGTAINCCTLGVFPEQVHQQNITELECSTTDKVLLVACESGVACAIDVASRKQVFTQQMNGALNCCTFLDDNTAVCGGDKGEIIMVDLRNTRSELKKLTFSPSQILSIVSAGKKCIASCADGSCYYFSAEDPSNGVVKLTGSNLDAVNSVKTIGNFVYTVCRDGIVRCYDLTQIV
ncbi:proteasomal ATPase-associated factor 1-like isoform X2 [Dysidea avara]|uniref:proteasomal ATPase-associated factor 1-like isoform X2 n=1 Tax=Dysidea avara TaxID=196820 RepID=UPI00332098C7